MNYTIQEYYINRTDLSLEKELLHIWAKFCLKSPPLPEFEKLKTVSDKFSHAFRFFEKNFRGNLCFFDGEKRFAVFGEGQKWLDSEIEEFRGQKTISLIMGATDNSGSKEGFLSMQLLKECFRRLKENYGYSVITWNQNRTHKQKPFERLMKTLGGKKTKDCWHV